MAKTPATFYARLGVTPRASLDEIRRAYRQLARRHHPDTALQADPTVFQEVHEAYRALIDAATAPRSEEQVILPITLEEAVHGGTYLFRRRRRLDLPAGLLPGERLTLPGQGERGDLHILIAYAPHARFRIVGKELWAKVDLMPWEAALGTRHRLATLDGLIEIPIPAGTRTGKRFRLKGRGLPQRGGTRGDLHIEIAVRTPVFSRPSARGDESRRGRDCKN